MKEGRLHSLLNRYVSSFTLFPNRVGDIGSRLNGLVLAVDQTELVFSHFLPGVYFSVRVWVD